MPRRRAAPDHDFRDDSRGPRLQRVLADAGVASRRRCEEMIEEGLVTVNGHVVASLPAWVDPAKDRILVEGKPIGDSTRHVYVMLFKPKGVVSTNNDPEGRPRAIDLVQHPSKARLYPVGRLDIDSSGLLLLTNDGELANRLTHPRYEMHKIYEVMVGGEVAPETLESLRMGIYLPDPGADDLPQRPAGSRTERSTLEVVQRDRTRTLLRMELREGRNRQIRRMMQRFGHPVKKLRRIQMGPLRLKGLAMGEWRDLTAAEVSELRRAAFATPQQRARRAEREAERARERLSPSTRRGARRGQRR